MLEIRDLDYDGIRLIELTDILARKNQNKPYTLDEMTQVARMLLKSGEAITYALPNTLTDHLMHINNNVRLIEDYIFRLDSGDVIMNFACVFVRLSEVESADTTKALEILNFLDSRAVAINPLSYQTYAKKLFEKKQATLAYIKE